MLRSEGLALGRQSHIVRKALVALGREIILCVRFCVALERQIILCVWLGRLWVVSSYIASILKVFRGSCHRGHHKQTKIKKIKVEKKKLVGMIFVGRKMDAR